MRRHKKTSKKQIKNSDDISSNLIPLVIGITGHRDLRPQDLDNLKGEIREIIKEIHEEYKDTPLLILSSLAKGTDCLAAEVALELKKEERIEIRLIVPLPFPLKHFRNEIDFDTIESREKFDALLNAADNWFELENDYNPSNRDEYFKKGGQYIAKHSQVLLALWDGNYTEGIAGTSQIVRFLHEEIHECKETALYMPDIVESGVIYHVQTPRLRNLPSKNPKEIKHEKFFHSENELMRLNYKKSEIEEMFKEICEKINNYNKDIIKIKKEIKPIIEKSEKELFKGKDLKKVRKLSTLKMWDMCRHYSISDYMAIKFQTKRKNIIKALFCFGFIAVFFYNFYSNIYLNGFVLIFYPLILGVIGGGLHYLAKNNGFHDKYLGYRALAEGLRIQIYWELCGVSRDSRYHDKDAAFLYMNKLKSELGWIRTALRICNIPISKDKVVEFNVFNNKEAIKMAKDCWINEQKNYLTNKIEKEVVKEKKYARLNKIFVAGGMLLAVILSIYDIYKPMNTSITHGFVIMMIGFGPALAVLISSYREKMVHLDDNKRYDWSKRLFIMAENQLEKYGESNIERASEILFELGKYSLEENGDWFFVFRGKSPEIPK